MREIKELNFSGIGAGLLGLAWVVFAAVCGGKKPPLRAPAPPPPVDGRGTSTPSSVQKPVINSFTAEPSTIERGQSSTLSWSISNATDMSIDHGVGAIQSRAQRQVFPSATTTYTLTAIGPGGSETATVTVAVSTAPPPPPPSTGGPRLSSAGVLQKASQDAHRDYA